MKDGHVPAKISDLKTKEYEHDLGRDLPSKINWLEFDQSRLAEVILVLSNNLREPGYYSHIVSGDEMYVVFPGAHVTISRGSDDDVHRAQSLGDSFGVSRSVMSFRLMFDYNHPEMHGREDRWEES